jgi:hypothetical protein
MTVDVLGSAAFKPVKNDMVGNIKVCEGIGIGFIKKWSDIS